MAINPRSDTEVRAMHGKSEHSWRSGASRREVESNQRGIVDDLVKTVIKERTHEE